MQVRIITSLSIILFLTGSLLSGQDTATYSSLKENKTDLIHGFIRGGLYSWRDKSDNVPQVTSAFSDLGIRLETGDRLIFKAFADVRFRYGSEFFEPVNKLDIREAFIRVNGKRWNLTLGQNIIKWGRCDFTNPISKLSPQNMISRSPDREDMDMGNLLANINWYPQKNINLEAVIIPFYRSSTLVIDPVPVPDYVTINQIGPLITDKKMFSMAFKADFRFSAIDWSISWFDGYDPMPGIRLTKFNIDFSGPVPVPITELTIKPYRNRVLGVDFETTAGKFGFRGEAAWSVPVLAYRTNEYVPMPDIRWAVGFDYTTGLWRFTGEYSGKYITDFVRTPVEPLIGTPPDYSKLAELLAIPGFDFEDYIQQQVGAFNRLYNYQLERYYHTAGLRTEADLLYGKLLPSVFTMYNFTSRDLLIIPEIKLKPADGLTITAGAEIYCGPSGSLYDLISDFMNGVYVSLRVDF